jgi:hypothetical protein
MQCVCHEEGQTSRIEETKTYGGATMWGPQAPVEYLKRMDERAKGGDECPFI